MSKALELLANIDKKYNNELKNTEEQLLSGIEQTSQTIRDSLNSRANITAAAIQQADENNAQRVEKELSQYQTLLQSKLSHLTKLNEQIQSQEQQAQNQAVQKKLTIL